MELNYKYFSFLILWEKMLKASPYLSQPITKKSHISGYNHDLSFYALDMQGSIQN